MRWRMGGKLRRARTGSSDRGDEDGSTTCKPVGSCRGGNRSKVGCWRLLGVTIRTRTHVRVVVLG